ncbi:serine/threonine-protein kinase [Streptomyces sp. HNM0645]|uniref:serine/threonine-protein kinase n=1 Tax=Streptomyces sp. HNM0645 TaxID=2782343 RepID=UPI0024B76FC5|nr:serine/threonine-protein kinase [Streptomyces sp. HNM0645]MDI9888089.1 serine/threonine-protein kinase [Streptomyces sp. HNM0645]
MNAPGELVDGRFELIERLGSGGMGTVWRARDTVLHREVALKAVRSDASASEAVRERVLREARALARLNHPNVVTVHHIVDAEPHPWIVMELVPGISLQDRLAQGPLTPPEAARIGRQVLSALRAAHAAGIQHRDVKPANVLLRPDDATGHPGTGGDTAVLTDFGIAALQGSTALTATGELIGSPEYMAPERVRGLDDTPASDLWSLGLVLYVGVEGVSPLRRPTTLATLAAVLDDAVPPPVRSGPLAPVLQALLVRDPAARPDAARLDAMLAQVETGTAPYWAQPTMTTATPPPGPVPGPVPPVPTGLDDPRPPSRFPEGGRANRAPLVAAVIAVALAITAAGVVALALRNPGGRATDDAKGPDGAPGPSVHASAAPASSAAPSPSMPPTPTVTVTASATQSTPADPAAPPPSSGRWIAQLFSEPVGSGTAARDVRLARIRETVPEARYLRSDDYASLRPGYWVIYAEGPFDDGRAALRFCAERDRTTADSCLGRYLSPQAADSALQCRPPADNPSGRCGRD